LNCVWWGSGKSVSSISASENMAGKKTNGFTLLEVLVVLLVVSLVSTLLVQGISLVLNMRYRFADHLHYQQAAVLQSYWFRQVCMGLTPDMPEGEGVFSGTGRQMHGLTLAPLQGEVGGAKQVDFSFERKAAALVLTYRQDDECSFELVRWPAGQGRFSYLDSNGHWYDQWPPFLGNHAQLPLAVRLQVESGRGPLVWLVNVAGRRQPRPWIKDLLP